MFPSLLSLTRPEDSMETRLVRVLDKSLQTPLTTGVIIINDIGLCVGHRGELAEKDAIPIASLIAKATDDADVFKGQVRYKQKRLQFHTTPEYTFALLRSDTPPPVASMPSPTSPVNTFPDTQTLTVSAATPPAISPVAGSFRTQESSGTVRGRGVVNTQQGS